MFTSVRRSGSVRFLLLSFLTLSLASLVTAAQAQTLPQLLPYTAKVIAGGGNTASTVGATCTRTGSTPSGNVSTDAYGDGCLATEIVLASGNGPRYAAADMNGNVYFSDWGNRLIRRIDSATGIVSTIAGGATANPAAAGACGAADPNHTAVAGDVFGDGCLGTAVALAVPAPVTKPVTVNLSGGLAFAPNGDLYFADEANYAVRKMSFSNGGVAAVVLTTGGSAYTSAPTVTFSAPTGGGVTATGVATISNGVVNGVTITNPGSGYSASAMPTVTFSVSGAATAATGTAVYTGVMAGTIGNFNGGALQYGFNSPCDTTAAPATAFGSTCLLDNPFGLTFDGAGNLYIAEEYDVAIMVLNTSAITTKVLGQSIAPQQMVKVVGAGKGATPCTNAAGSAGCYFSSYVTGTPLTSAYLDNSYGVAVDTSGNVYVADEYYNVVAQANAGTLSLNTFAGNNSHTATTEKQTQRAAAGSFGIGNDYSVATDANNNFYVSDYTNNFIWRVDSPSNSMYVLAGGGTATTAGSPCASTGVGNAMTATDVLGDGCPALLAKLSTYTGTVSTDKYGDVLLGDVNNSIVREISTGTQFGNTGAMAVDHVDVHFAAGDTPITASGNTVPFAVAPSSIFGLGTPICTLNSDTTTDCVIAVDAAPSKTGPYAGTLTVISTNNSTTPAVFPLSGNFTEDPGTRLTVSISDVTSCSTTATTSTFLTGDSLTVTGTLTLNGPAPTGTITFFSSTNGGAAVQIGTPQAVVNIGTASAPVYGATVKSAFTTGNTVITASYNSNGGYYNASMGTGSFNSATATFALAAAPNAVTTQTVTAGQTALFSFTTTPTVYTGTITYSVTGLPANTSYTLNPTSIAVTGCSQASTIALSILTTANNPTTQPAGMASGRGPWSLFSIAAALGLALLMGVRRRRVPGLAQMMMALLLLAGATGLVACNGTHVNAPPATPTNSATNPYTITVTGTGSAGVTASTTFNLIVQ